MLANTSRVQPCLRINDHAIYTCAAAVYPLMRSWQQTQCKQRFTTPRRWLCIGVYCHVQSALRSSTVNIPVQVALARTVLARLHQKSHLAPLVDEQRGRLAVAGLDPAGEQVPLVRFVPQVLVQVRVRDFLQGLDLVHWDQVAALPPTAVSMAATVGPPNPKKLCSNPRSKTRRSMATGRLADAVQQCPAGQAGAKQTPTQLCTQ